MERGRIFKLIFLLFWFSTGPIGALDLVPNDSLMQAVSGIENQLKEAENQNDIKAQSEYLFELGHIYFAAGAFGDAYEQFSLSIDLLKTQGDKAVLIAAYLQIGDEYKDKMVLEVALEFYLKALDLSQEDKSKKTGDIYTAIGGLYYDQEDYSQSREYYQKSLELYQLNKAEKELAASYNNLGEMYRFQANYAEALEYYHQAVAINKAYSNTTYLAINYNNMADVYLKQNRPQAALEKLKESQALLLNDPNKELLAASYTSIGHYYFEQGSYSQAIHNYQKTLDFKLESYPRKDIIRKDAYWGLVQSYRANGDIAKELSALKHYMALKDAVFNAEQARAIFEVQTQYETREKEKEIAYLHEKSAKEAEEKKIQRRNLFIVISLLLLIVGLLIYAFLLKSRSLKQKTQLLDQTHQLHQLEMENRAIENKKLQLENKELEAREEINRLNREKLATELEHKERELSATALHVIGKNEMLSNLRQSMESLIENNQNDQAQVLKGLIREINHNINLDKDWDTFKLHFEKVHPGFFTRLKEQYSELTVDELKLCAYLRINLSSKEIAQILNVTQVAINKRRNRLRKKIELDASGDLFDFLSKI